MLQCPRPRQRLTHSQKPTEISTELDAAFALVQIVAPGPGADAERDLLAVEHVGRVRVVRHAQHAVPAPVGRDAAECYYYFSFSSRESLEFLSWIRVRFGLWRVPTTRTGRASVENTLDGHSRLVSTTSQNSTEFSAVAASSAKEKPAAKNACPPTEPWKLPFLSYGVWRGRWIVFWNTTRHALHRSSHRWILDSNFSNLDGISIRIPKTNRLALKNATRIGPFACGVPRHSSKSLSRFENLSLGRVLCARALGREREAVSLPREREREREKSISFAALWPASCSCSCRV